MRRRRLLAAVGAASVGGLAGCGERAPTADDGGGESAGDGGGDGGGDAGTDDRDTATDELPTDWPAGEYADYDATTVAVRTAEGDDVGAVRAAVADTRDKRVLGLSAAPTLPENAGMLFVYDSPQESLTFIMPDMEFGIDIVYVDADRTITRIHNAPEPGPNEDGSEQRYPGSGQYVLEVPYEWTDRNGVGVGDSLSFDL
ncbi:hypothetical protein CK500_03240 [Halorubrum salipaludis]|uniref:DUF192 domain-containing protein n=1 Tax=Halorubrum salipaludis TaxID=2032630 RepID=A0A2A2FJ13_9EURY|nr:DUF192 domain-containing protein [Halorubrum salipaludis]PAU84543.1 hypothetical protein CK500_03240 [Halorubrum salipaludis]